MKPSFQADTWQTLASYLERDGAPLGEVEMSVQVYGIYSIPEEWIKLDACGAVDLWPYQTKISDIIFNDGKINQRELTEEEKKEIELKKQPRKPANTGKKPEEPTQEEKDRIEKERLEKEEKDRKIMEEWNALDEKAKFYKTKENPTI